MDPTSIVEDTEWTLFCPQMDRRTRWNQYTPFQLHWDGGYNRLRESQDAYLVQIWWFQLKSIKSYCVDKMKLLEFWVKWSKWPWRSRSKTFIFNTSREYPRMHVRCKFGDSSPNQWRVIVRTSWISKNSESKWPKWPWRSKSKTSVFNTSWEYCRMHVWCKFDDSSSNLWWVIVRTNQSS